MQLMCDVKSPFFYVGNFQEYLRSITPTPQIQMLWYSECFIRNCNSVKTRFFSVYDVMLHDTICSGWCDSMRPSSFTVVPVVKSWKQEKHTDTNGRGKGWYNILRGDVSASRRKGESRGRDTVRGESKSILPRSHNSNF